MQNHLSNNGFGVDFVSTFNALLTAPAINILVECTSQELVSKGYERTNANEMLKFLATKFLQSRIHVQSDVAWSDYLEPLAVRYNFQLMEITRFNRMLNSIRGFDIDKRNADNNDTWMQRKNFLRHLAELETAIFKPSVNILLNKKNGIIVTDDELLGSKANDVETKNLSNRKLGGKGPVSDCVADSCVNNMLGMRLRIILDTQKEAHATPLKTIGKALLGWIYDPNLLSKGYLLARDCLKWMTMMQKHNCVTRYKL